MHLEQREYLRRAVLQTLAARQTAEFTIPAIMERCTDRLPDVTFDEIDTNEACAFLEGLNLIRKIESELGGFTVKWQCTTQGMLFCERNHI
jgi:hypothetical protein